MASHSFVNTSAGFGQPQVHLAPTAGKFRSGRALRTAHSQPVRKQRASAAGSQLNPTVKEWKPANAEYHPPTQQIVQHQQHQQRTMRLPRGGAPKTNHAGPELNYNVVSAVAQAPAHNAIQRLPRPEPQAYKVPAPIEFNGTPMAPHDLVNMANNLIKALTEKNQLCATQQQTICKQAETIQERDQTIQKIVQENTELRDQNDTLKAESAAAEPTARIQKLEADLERSQDDLNRQRKNVQRAQIKIQEGYAKEARLQNELRSERRTTAEWQARCEDELQQKEENTRELLFERNTLKNTKLKVERLTQEKQQYQREYHRVVFLARSLQTQLGRVNAARHAEKEYTNLVETAAAIYHTMWIGDYEKPASYPAFELGGPVDTESLMKMIQVTAESRAAGGSVEVISASLAARLPSTKEEMPATAAPSRRAARAQPQDPAPSAPLALYRDHSTRSDNERSADLEHTPLRASFAEPRATNSSRAPRADQAATPRDSPDHAGSSTATDL